MANEIKNNLMGKTKTEKFDKEIAKEMAAEVVHKRYPIIPKKMIKSRLDKVDKKLNKRSKKGFRI